MKRIYIIIYCFSYLSFSQVDVQLLHNFDLPISEHELQIDSSEVKILQIPLLSFYVNIYSNPDIRTFISNKTNNLSINVQDYYANMNDFSSHILDLKNHLLYYGFKSDNSFYSFGLDHRLWMETSFSKELTSLVIHGNYQHMNNEITLNNNGLRLYNYLSLFFGYTHTTEKMIIGSRFKVIKGIASFGVNGRETSIQSIDNFYTEDTPFTTQINTDFDMFQNASLSILSNLGVAVDLSLKYSFSDKISMFSSISELGFISWKENHHFSEGSYNFDGVEYTLDEDLMNEFSTVYDTIINIFDIQEKPNQHVIRPLSYRFDVGVNYTFDNLEKHQLTLNYNFKKLDFEYNFLHTGTISYLTYLKAYKLSIIPMYSFNRYNYTNFSLFLNKKWKDSFVSNIYMQNIFSMLKKQKSGMDIGFGVELFLLF